MNRQTAAQDEHDPFGGMASGAQLERLEGGAHDPNRLTMAAFEGSMRAGPGGGDALDLRLADPGAEVVAYVRPGRKHSVAPLILEEGQAVKVTQATFLANRGTLCTAAELRAIQHQQASPGAQATARDLASMRRDSIQASRLGMDPQKLEAEREKAARELGEIQERQAADMARAHAELTKPPPPKPTPQTAEELEERIATMRANAEGLGRAMGAKGADELRRVVESEIADLRQAFELAQQLASARADQVAERRAAAPAGGKSPRERLVELKAMEQDDLITPELAAQRRAEILKDV